MKIAIIGGSGFENPSFAELQERTVQTPYGTVIVKEGVYDDIPIVLLSRHGKDHTLTPSKVNYRANMYALKESNVTHILATTACGSLRENIQRGDLVIVDQFIDFTRHRHITFHDSFEPGNAVHTPMATPFSEKIRSSLIQGCTHFNFRHHTKGTVITIEGPRFSTKAESHMFRSWGADVINMSIAPETILANELGIPYSAIAISTDYDCWKEDEVPVTWDEILKTFQENVGNVVSLVQYVITNLARPETPSVPVVKPPFDLKQHIRTVPHWPKTGVMFRDITTLLQDPVALRYTMDRFVAKYKDAKIDKILAIESRGFIFGSILADRLHLPLVLARKPGKLPSEKVTINYQTEYSLDTLEIHTDAITEGDAVLIIDDLLATGGTARAAADLVTKCKGTVYECAFVITLPELGGIQKLGDLSIFNLIEFDGE